MATPWDLGAFCDFLSNTEYQPVFWSGSSIGSNGETIRASSAAESFCENNSGYKTVGQLVDEAGFDQNDPNIDWDAASKAFADESSGQAQAFLGDEVGENSVFNRVERDAIAGNENLDDNVVVHNLEGDSQECPKTDMPENGSDIKPDKPSGGGSPGKEYVVMGAKLECDQGKAPSKLIVLPTNRVNIKGKIKANITDCKPMVNVPPFGMCDSKTNPAVIAATAAAQGVHTPAPCTPGCSVWMGGKTDLTVAGKPALQKGDSVVCTIGAGKIEVKDCGQ
ncbi:MAG: DUF4280 domain-containing protein [Oscillospiraceae bacterium]|nr:DUF4280 domain-containing protein [Oscillospiraceae bacterium]